jgi:ribonuclease G
VEYYTEDSANENLAGNIYLGKVRRVLPGMHAAFVDIGLSKAAFLYSGDVCDPWEGTDCSYKEIPLNGQSCPLPRPEIMSKIEVLLQVGQEVLVQVSKEPMGNKGPKVTNYITLPGRKLVFMPSVTNVGISRRIEDGSERERLRGIINKLKKNEAGFIARTAAEGMCEEKLAAEMHFLYSLWQSIRTRLETARAPCLMYRDLSVSLRATRDLFTQDVEKLVVDCAIEYKPLTEFISAFMPSLLPQVELYRDAVPLFQTYGVDEDLKEAFKNKIWLRSGGYIVFQGTEALTAVDVNTGRYVGSHNLEETVLNTNLEAIKEIAYQLRLRNIGGLIVIDFIDMQKQESKNLVVQTLIKALHKDRAKTNVLEMSALGLVEMTRKRVREPWTVKEQDSCPYCHGSGHVKQVISICHEIYRALEGRFVLSRHENALNPQLVQLRVHPDINHCLNNEESISLAQVQHRLGIIVNLTIDNYLHREEFNFNA